MFENITNYIEQLICMINPSKGVYIAVQQRQRRFKSMADKEFWDSIKIKYGIPITSSWNNSAITPGTEFMEKLHLYILEWIEKQKMHIIYSSYKTSGEGEQKLAKFTISSHSENPNLRHIIYGLDADLIFLSLLRKSEIYLLRQNTEINNNDNEEMIFVDIKVMKELIL